jgi:hypothetical protein
VSLSAGGLPPLVGGGESAPKTTHSTTGCSPASDVTVVRFQGRHYLRNGYHRVAGLVQAGVTTVPAVVTDTDTFENMVVGDGGFGGEVATWRVPPVMTDFWDETVSIASARPIRRTGYHIRADEIRLPA